jgi:hypothetical protein
MPIPFRSGGAIESGIHASLRRLKTELADASGVSSPATQAAGIALAKSLRRTLNVRGPKRHPSAPGEPPHRLSGRLDRSVGTEVVGDALRVGVSDFVGRLLETGVNVEVTPRVSRRIAAIAHQRARRLGFRLTIAARPFMQRALDAALPDMGDAAVSTLQRRGATS